MCWVGGSGQNKIKCSRKLFSFLFRKGAVMDKEMFRFELFVFFSVVFKIFVFVLVLSEYLELGLRVQAVSYYVLF